MPKRTNEYQEIADSLQRLVMPKNAIVISSAMVCAPNSKIEREIDILIQYENNFKIAVEVKDHSRSIDITGVESYIGKYTGAGGVEVDKVIIVAHNFSAAAKERAEKVNFDLCKLNELDKLIEGIFTKSEKSMNIVLSSKKQPNEVEVTAFDKNGLNIPLHLDVFTPLPIKEKIGKIRILGNQLLKKSLGKFATEQYNKYLGILVHVIIEVVFSNHVTEQKKSIIPLNKMVFDFGERMLLPATEAKKYEYILNDQKNDFIVETAITKNSKTRITYKENKSGKSPQSFNFFHKPNDSNETQKKEIRKTYQFSQFF